MNKTNPPESLDSIRRLARLFGVEVEYQDVRGQNHQTSDQTLLSVLRALGAEVDSEATALEAIEQHTRKHLRRMLEPVIVAWNGNSVTTNLTLPVAQADGWFDCMLECESSVVRQRYALNKMARVSSFQVGEEEYVTLRWMLPGNLPWGYHTLKLELPAASFQSLVISAPSEAFWPDGTQQAAGPKSAATSLGERAWGCFLPLYALRSAQNWGAGDFSDLERLANWTAELGGSLVGTLPLLASYLESPCDPSPYAPVSRLFWNEFYLDITRIPELEHCEAAKTLLGSSGFTHEIMALRSTDFVDYQRITTIKRKVLQALSQEFFSHKTERFNSFVEFVRADPALEDYARFRATQEQLQMPWREWPTRLREGQLKAGDYEEQAVQYHLYVQWLAAEQLQAVADNTGQRGCGLYLDLPLGVRADSYDAWRNQHLYVSGISAGAPPDAVWSAGQNWGFPPLHPEAIRDDGYRHVRDYLKRQLRISRFLRIDHVMGLHRLFCIPAGMTAQEGTYIQYRPDEWYAILCLESHRHRAGIIGENLGTVPAVVNQQMRQHHIRQMHVLQYELEAAEEDQLAIDARLVASVNTHDLPMFAAWWKGDDLRERQQLGLLNAQQFAEELLRRTEQKKILLQRLHHERWLDELDSTLEQVVVAVEKHLAASSAEIVLVNLEDLWGETRPQNTPGTALERANWQRKAIYPLEQIMQHREVVETLEQVNRLRRDDRSRHGDRTLLN